MKCSICNGSIKPHKKADGEIYWTKGHNAEPVTGGRCCDDCNTGVVIPRRIQLINKQY